MQCIFVFALQMQLAMFGRSTAIFFAVFFAVFLHTLPADLHGAVHMLAYS
jgi:hypothetical protein